MKILPKPLRSGSRLARNGESAGRRRAGQAPVCRSHCPKNWKCRAHRRRGRTDITVDEMESTVGEFYRLSLPEEVPVQELALDADLQDIFNISPKRRNGVRPAVEMLHQHRKPIVDKVAYWSGVQRPIVKRLVEAICKRVEGLGLRVDVRRESEYLTEFIVYTTALSMNYLVRGKFIHP